MTHKKDLLFDQLGENHIQSFYGNFYNQIFTLGTITNLHLQQIFYNRFYSSREYNQKKYKRRILQILIYI